MTQPFRRLANLGDAKPDEVVVHIARAGGSAKARVLMPSVPGVERALEYFTLEHAATVARSVAGQHGLGLAVLVAESSGLSWLPEWNALFGTGPTGVRD